MHRNARKCHSASERSDVLVLPICRDFRCPGLPPPLIFSLTNEIMEDVLGACCEDFDKAVKSIAIGTLRRGV